MSSHHNDKATFLERLIFNNRPAVIAISRAGERVPVLAGNPDSPLHQL